MEFLAIASAALLLLSLPPTSESTAASKLPPFALDATGAQLLPGVQYYAEVVGKGFLGLAPTNPRAACPLDVVEDHSAAAAASGGLPLTFLHLNPSDTSPMRTSTDLNVVFAAATICGQSAAWKLGNFEDRTGMWHLTTGGTLGNPGVWTISSRFKLERYTAIDGSLTMPAVYKVVFCPHACRFCKVVCGDIGVVGGDSQKKKLGITVGGSPMLLTFRKA